jgi:AAHS family 4-hydroxybenzoate transporter-like MFS transporter
VAGIGLGGALPNALALTGEYCPARRRATLVVIMFCGFSLGSILGGGLTAALISQFGWRPVFLVGGALPLLLVPALMLLLPESLLFLVTRGASATKIEALLRRIDSRFKAPAGARFINNETTPGGVSIAPIAQLLRGGRGLGTLLLWMVFFLNLMVLFFLQNWLPTILTDSGFKTETAILISTLVAVGGIACGVLTGPLMDRFGPYRVLAALYLGGTAFVVLLGFASTSLAALVAATLGAGFCVSGGQKSVNALAVMFYPTHMRSTGVGWALGVGRLGSIVGPLLGGWLMARGWSTVSLFELAAVPMFCATVVVIAMGIRYGIRRAEKVANEEREAIA